MRRNTGVAPVRPASQLCFITDALRLSSLPAPLITRAIHDTREALTSFEGLRVFSDYRTPTNIRAFIRFCVYVVPLILSPHFAALGTYSFPFFSYIIATLVTLLFLLLKNVQGELENPFSSRKGRPDIDDIRTDAMVFQVLAGESQFAWRTCTPPSSPHAEPVA